MYRMVSPLLTVGGSMPGVVEEHLEYLRLAGRARTSRYARRRALARLQAAAGLPLLELTRADLLAWRAGLAVDDDVVRQYVSHAHQFYAWAVGAGYLPASPAENIPVPRRTQRLPRPMADAQLFAAVSGAPERILPWLVLAAWCGLRAKEIALLRRENVLDTGQPPCLLIAHDATKGRRERVVPLCSYAAGVLLPLLPSSGWVFRRRDGRPGPNTPATVSHLSNAYLHKAGITATLHQMRHRYGTTAYRLSRDLRELQDLMGHARPETTAGYVLIDQSAAIAWLEEMPVPPRLKAVGE
jgi:integrase